MKKFIRIIPLLLFGVLLVAAFLFHQDVYDWWRLRDYDPPKKVLNLAQDTKLSEEGTRLFYVGHPEIASAELFNQQCHVEEFSIVLGCYTKRNIYLYNIEDKRLQGVMEVTAAHEMLHVAYERLSGSERDRINGLLEASYKNVTNPRIRAAVKQYRENDASSVPNELHSILGTEVRELSDELEAYYGRYFIKRAAVVGLSEQYEKEFTSRETRVKKIDKQFASLKVSIEQNQALLVAKRTDIDNEASRLERLRSQDQIAAYNSAVPNYNYMISQYNLLVNTTKDDIATYNQLVEERNNLAVEVNDLVQAIDSTPETIE